MEGWVAVRLGSQSIHPQQRDSGEGGQQQQQQQQKQQQQQQQKQQQQQQQQQQYGDPCWRTLYCRLEGNSLTLSVGQGQGEEAHSQAEEQQVYWCALNSYTKTKRVSISTGGMTDVLIVEGSGCEHCRGGGLFGSGSGSGSRSGEAGGGSGRGSGSSSKGTNSSGTNIGTLALGFRSSQVRDTWLQAVRQCVRQRRIEEMGTAKRQGTRIVEGRGVFFELDEHFEAHNVVGTGGFGMVMAATDKRSGTSVAIKLIQNAFERPMLARRVVREVRLMRLISHPNVVSILDLLPPPPPSSPQPGDSGSTALLDSFKDVYIVSELMDTDLAHVTKCHAELSHSHVQWLFYQLVCAVDHMHSMRVLHRDLKPSNIFVNKNCAVKVGDLGHARRAAFSPRGGSGGGEGTTDDDAGASHPGEDSSEMTDYVITRWYRAPEVLLGAPYCFGVDVWSLGCIFAELHTGQPLFEATNYVSMLNKILQLTGSPAAASASTSSDPTTATAAAAACGGGGGGKDGAGAGAGAGNNLSRFLHGSAKALRFLEALPQQPPQDLAQAFPTATAEARDLLGRLLTFSPDARISARDALMHPYFQSLQPQQRWQESGARAGGGQRATSSSSSAAAATSMDCSGPESLLCEGVGVEEDGSGSSSMSGTKSGGSSGLRDVESLEDDDPFLIPQLKLAVLDECVSLGHTECRGMRDAAAEAILKGKAEEEEEEEEEGKHTEAYGFVSGARRKKRRSVDLVPTGSRCCACGCGSGGRVRSGGDAEQQHQQEQQLVIQQHQQEQQDGGEGQAPQREGGYLSGLRSVAALTSAMAPPRHGKAAVGRSKSFGAEGTGSGGATGVRSSSSSSSSRRRGGKRPLSPGMSPANASVGGAHPHGQQSRTRHQQDQHQAVAAVTATGMDVDSVGSGGVQGQRKGGGRGWRGGA